MTTVERPRNRQGRPRKWGDHCAQCARQVQMQWMRQGLCAACYQRRRRAGTMPNTYVDPTKAREHLADIYATGVSYRWIAEQAGTSTVNLHHVAKGNRRRISSNLADKILSVPIPESVDEQRLQHRLLQTAGLRGIYTGVERRYRQSRQQRGVPRRRRDRKRRSLKALFAAERDAFLAQFAAEREEFMRWLYEGTPVEEPVMAAPTRNADWAAGLACGECDQPRCTCGYADDHDLWIPTLADHDQAAETLVEAA